MTPNLNKINFSKLKRINVVGTTGVGKTTFSKKMASLLNQAYIEMDQVFWGANWKKPTNRDFYDNLKSFLDNTPSFVLDGNYTKTTALKWAYTETVIWLNLPLNLTLWQLLKRSFKRVLLRKEIWPGTGNKESLYQHLFTTDSIFYWLFKTFKGNQIKYNFEMNSKQWSHIQFIELTSNHEMNLFIAALKDSLQASTGDTKN